MSTRVTDLLALLVPVSILASLPLAAAGAIVLAGANVRGEPAQARRATEPRQIDAREALRRARLEQGLVQAEKTVVLLGELVAADLGERR